MPAPAGRVPRHCRGFRPEGGIPAGSAGSGTGAAGAPADRGTTGKDSVRNNRSNWRVSRHAALLTADIRLEALVSHRILKADKLVAEHGVHDDDVVAIEVLADALAQVPVEGIVADRSVVDQH